MTGSFIALTLWVVGFEEHLKLNAVGILECQYRTIFAIGNSRVRDAELLEPCKPLVESGAGVDFEAHVIEPGTPRIEGLALIPVMLLEFDDGSRRLMHQQNRPPSISANPVDLDQVQELRPPSGARLGVTD